MQDLKDKNILVTGGAGFIGSNLCEYLILNGAYVTCLDNLSTGHKNNIQDLLNHPRFKFISGDIRQLNTCQQACKGQEFVLHQAALGSVPRSINDPNTSNEVNVSGFLNMLIASRDQKIKRFIFASSSSTYGDSKKLPKFENHIGKPMSPYALTKYINELYAEIFQKTFSLDYIGLRYFNVYGRRQDPDGVYAAVIPLFTKKLINHISPKINGDGSYSRDFTYIDDVIRINILAITTKNKDSINEIYNVAAAGRTTILELFNYLKKSLSKLDVKIKNIHPIFGQNRPGDVPHSFASIEKAERLLNYKPLYNIEDGINKSINWYWNDLSKKN